MKKKVILITIALVLLTATVIMASGSLSLETVTTVEAFEPSFDALALYMGYDTEDKFEQFHKTALFMGRYCTTKESFSYIEQMILAGCDPNTTMDIYQFYLTTNEDISIVRQIYDMVYDGEPIINRDAVFESAFNEITNNKCGVLTQNDVISYLEKGLSVDEIMQANLLSRKGVMTINEILDSRLLGISWEKIIETVSGEKIKLSDNVTASEIARAMTVATVTNNSLNTVLSSDNEDERLSNVAKSVNKKLKSKGYWKGRKSENFEKLSADANKKGISESKLTELMDKGYSEVQLINIISDPSCSPQTIDALTESQVTE